VTLAEVLNTVREIYGYEYRVEGSLIYVLPATMQTRMYKVDYLTSLRRGSTDMRVSSNAITTPGAPTGGTVTPGAPSAGISTQSTQVGTISSSDFWDELRRTVAALAGCRSAIVTVGGLWPGKTSPATAAARSS
jgi:MSHA biogenesis protein MshL